MFNVYTYFGNDKITESLLFLVQTTWLCACSVSASILVGRVVECGV